MLGPSRSIQHVEHPQEGLEFETLPLRFYDLEDCRMCLLFPVSLVSTHVNGAKPCEQDLVCIKFKIDNNTDMAFSKLDNGQFSSIKKRRVDVHTVCRRDFIAFHLSSLYVSASIRGDK